MTFDRCGGKGVIILKSQKTAINKDKEEVLDTTPVSDEKPEEEVEDLETKVESAEETETEETPTETKDEPKKGFTARVRELSAEAKEAEAQKTEALEQVKSLQDRIAELTGSVEPQVGFQQESQPMYTPQVEPGQEVSQEQYKQDVMRSADALVTLKIKQSEAVNRITNETADVMHNYPELDPKNETFNKDLSDSITEAVEASVKASPYTVSVKKVVEKLMKPYKGAVEKEVGQATENIAKQVSEAALRPNSIRKPEKSANEKSIEELEQELGVVQV